MPTKAERLLAEFPQGNYNDVGRTFRLVPEAAEVKKVGRVAVITAGTSDLPVAEEARETARVDGRRRDHDPRRGRGGTASIAHARR